MSGAQQVTFMNQRSFVTPPGSQTFSGCGTFTWVAPAGITSVSVVAVGAGSGANRDGYGAGADLRYLNNYTVTPGTSYSVRVHSGGVGNNTATVPAVGGHSSFVNCCTLRAKGGRGTGVNVGSGGGAGGSFSHGGGGASGAAGGGGTGGKS